MKSLADVFKNVMAEDYAREPDIMFVLPGYLYDEMKATGEYDMEHYVRRVDRIPVDQPSLIVITHPQPSSADRRAEIARKSAAGEPLGAFHNGLPISPGVVALGTLMPMDGYGAKRPPHKDD